MFLNKIYKYKNFIYIYIMNETKRFTNLSSQYKKFLISIEPQLNNLINQDDKSDKYSKKIGFNDLITLDKVQTSIEKTAKDNEIFENDINILILNCDSKNIILEKLRDFVHLRNVQMLNKAIKSSKYKKFINQLKDEYLSRNKVDITEKDLERKLLLIWQKYFEYFNGLWKFVEYNNGKIIKIDFIDPKDKEEFLSL